MRMESKEKIIKCYNDTASNHAAERIDETFQRIFRSLLLREFASVNKDKGLCADFGCGPGQTTKFLYDNGVKDIIGIDISSGMNGTARTLFPEIKFENGDILKISFPSNYFGSALKNYILHSANELRPKKE